MYMWKNIFHVIPTWHKEILGIYWFLLGSYLKVHAHRPTYSFRSIVAQIMPLIVTYICAIIGPQYWHCFTTRWPLRCHYFTTNKTLSIYYPHIRCEFFKLDHVLQKLYLKYVY